MNIDYLKKMYVFDKNNEFIYFPVNKVMQTTIARNYLKDRCIIYKDNPKLWNEYFKKTILILFINLELLEIQFINLNHLNILKNRINYQKD